MGPVATDRPSSDAGRFSDRLIHMINDGALALLVSLGHRTGLFEVMAGRPPSSAGEVAEAAGLDEQRVHEWLEGMTRGGIVSHDRSSGTYELPAEHAACLTEATLSGNLAALAEYVPLLCMQEDRIIAHFRKNRHTPFEARPSFRQLISKAAHETDRAVVAALVERIFPLVPGLLDALRSGIDVLDIECGSGRAVNLMAASFPRSQFHGYARLELHIDRANRRAFELGLTNVHFRLKDIADLDETAHYDLITDFDAIRKQPRPQEVLAHVCQALRPGGILLMQEVAATSHVDESLGIPKDSALWTAKSLAEEKEEGSDALTGEQQVRRLLLAAGFESVELHRLPHHVYNCYFVATRGRAS